MGKKKIREEFDKIFKLGDESTIKAMLEKYPWLLDEVSSRLDQHFGVQEQVVAALGVMEDELGGAVPIDEIIFSLKLDFNTVKSEQEIQELLSKVQNLGFVRKEATGWRLTSEGGRVCDDYLNRTLHKLGN